MVMSRPSTSALMTRAPSAHQRPEPPPTVGTLLVKFIFTSPPCLEFQENHSSSKDLGKGLFLSLQCCSLPTLVPSLGRSAGLDAVGRAVGRGGSDRPGRAAPAHRPGLVRPLRGRGLPLAL